MIKRCQPAEIHVELTLYFIISSSHLDFVDEASLQFTLWEGLLH